MKFTLKRLLATAASVTLAACAAAGIAKHAKRGFAFYLGDIAWFIFLTGVLITIALALAVLVKVARHHHAARIEGPLMRPIRRYVLATAVALTASATALITTNAAGQTGPSVLRLTVPLRYVHFHATSTASKGISPGDGFQEGWLPPHTATASRQDAVAIATFRQAIFLGTITLKQGQLVYAGSTNNQDNAEYAILGGTGRYQSARGTMSTRPLSHGRLQITITTDAS